MKLPNATWRAEVLNEAARLEDERERTAADHNGRAASDPNDRLAAEQIKVARTAADWPGAWNAIVRWGSGSDLETATRALQLADQALLEIQDVPTVAARLPEIAASVQANLPPGDARIREYSQFLDHCVAEDLRRGSLARERVRAIKFAADQAADLSHSNLRHYRNWLLIVGLVLSGMLIAVAVIHALDNGFFQLCQPKTDCSVSVDIAQILAAGAVGGIVAGGFALRRLQAYGGPYALPLWQSLLRVPFGAAGALLGISIMQSGLITAVEPQDNSNLIPYALFFGYAPDYLLRLLDRKVNEVSESARTKNDPLGGERSGG